MKKNNVGAGPVSAHQENKGITLIALIITIIVMLILVAVSISIALNTGLFDAAGKAAQKTKIAKEQEKELASGKVNIDGTTYNSIDEYISGMGDIKPGQRANDDNATYKGVTIPKGFTVSKIPGEYENVDDGIVIYDIPEKDLTDPNFSWTDGSDSDIYPDVQQKYNQFVWVPVQNPYITASYLQELVDKSTEDAITNEVEAVQSLINDGTAPIFPMAVQMLNGDYRGILYNFDNWNGTTGIKVREFSSSETVSYENVSSENKLEGIIYAGYEREPGTSYYDRDSKYTSYDITQDHMQLEYNKMVKSVIENGGFYVARYELTEEKITEDGTETIIYGSKRGQTIASASSSSANRWYGLNEECNGMYNKTTDNVQSQMISGAQWDQIMIWMRNVTNISNSTKYYITYSTDMGNLYYSDDYSSSNLISGRVDKFSVNKVFDLAGNLEEWSTEVAYSDVRVLRGTVHLNQSEFTNMVSNRDLTQYCGFPDVTDSLNTTRCVLYIK